MFGVFKNVFSTEFKGQAPDLPWTKKSESSHDHHFCGPQVLRKEIISIKDYALSANHLSVPELVDRLKRVHLKKGSSAITVQNLKDIIYDYLSVQFTVYGDLVRGSFVERFWMYKKSTMSDADYTDQLINIIIFAQDLQKLPDEDLALFCTFGKVESVDGSLDELKGLLTYKRVGITRHTIIYEIDSREEEDCWCVDACEGCEEKERCKELYYYWKSDESRYTVKVDIDRSMDPEETDKISFTIIDKHESVELFDCYVEVFVHASLLFTGLVPACSRETLNAIFWSVFRNEQCLPAPYDENAILQDVIRVQCLRHIWGHETKPLLISDF